MEAVAGLHHGYIIPIRHHNMIRQMDFHSIQRSAQAMGGLDIFRAVSNYLFADLGAETRSPVLNDLADQGRLGVKAGAGFYDYGPEEGLEKIRWRNDLFQRQWDLLKENPFKK